MFGRTALLAAALLLALALVMPVACADQSIPIDQHFSLYGRTIIVYIVRIDLGSEEINNVHYDVDPANTVWAQIYYKFENTGDTSDQGFISPVLYDSKGTAYIFDPNHELPTTVHVNPHFRTGLLMVEIPVPKNATLTQLVCRDVEDHLIEIPPPSVTPSPSPTGTSVPPGPPTTGGYSWHDCLPLMPIAMAGGLAGIGIVINRCGLRNKR